MVQTDIAHGLDSPVITSCPMLAKQAGVKPEHTSPNNSDTQQLTEKMRMDGQRQSTHVATL
jgi:hypothetical protein